jgi:hypothetical protein
MAAWAETFRNLGQSVLGVLRAEAAAVEADLRRTGQQAAGAAALLGAAAVVAFWTIGVLIAAVVALFTLWLPVWGAALLVFALFAGVAGGLGWLGVRRLKEMENPVASIRRRISDHLDWWQNTLLAPPPSPLPAPGARAADAFEDTGFDDPYREEIP